MEVQDLRGWTIPRPNASCVGSSVWPSGMRPARRHDLEARPHGKRRFRRAIPEGLRSYTEPVITLARICTTVGSFTLTESRRFRAKRSGVGNPIVMVFTRADW